MDTLFTVTGKVVRGAGEGRKLGFPTANVELDFVSPLTTLQPKDLASAEMIGVFATLVYIHEDFKNASPVADRQSKHIPQQILEPIQTQTSQLTQKDPLLKRFFLGALHFGPRSTFGKVENLWEVYLLDFDGDLYGKTLTIFTFEKLRGSVKFTTIENLVKQIELDVENVRKFFK